MIAFDDPATWAAGSGTLWAPTACKGTDYVEIVQ